MNKSLIALLALFLIIASCTTTTLKGTPVGEVQSPEQEALQPTDACAAVLCAPGFQCQEGKCLCPAGKKECSGKCINNNQCCSQSECAQGELCQSNTCTFDCSTLKCQEGMTCSTKEKRCVCPQDYKWCEYQSQCVPQDHCCSRFDCKSNERCVDTITSAEICISKEGTACKIFNTVGFKDLTIPSGTFRVNITRIVFDDSIDLEINGEKLTLGADQSKPLGDISVGIKKFRELGGECRDFDREADV